MSKNILIKFLALGIVSLKYDILRGLTSPLRATSDLRYSPYVFNNSKSSPLTFGCACVLNFFTIGLRIWSSKISSVIKSP